MKSTLERLLETLGFSSDEQTPPWILSRYGSHFESQIEINIAYVATMIFARERLKSIQDRWINEALETLFQNQNSDGSWNWWSGVEEFRVESTAMAIHAIAIAKPRGWEHICTKAKEWLWAHQDTSGCWIEPSAPDPVYLTVLVLDAIELANGGNKVTFTVDPKLNSKSSILEFGKSTTNKAKRRFQVALSFPGDERPFIEKIANKLAQKIGRERIFYDRFYEAELARPNLDVYLQKIYHDDSELVAIFLCENYEKKEWCGLEWRAIRDLIKKRQDKDIMPFRIDQTDISGLFSIDGYIDVKRRTEEEIADLILQRLESSTLGT